MAGANSNIQVTDLDFNLIKNNLKTYLQGQAVFQDYNFDGSALSTLLDILAYNTQYNSFYLNMVANEMFLDTSIRRSSAVSHAKLLDYVPKSNVAPTATINLRVNQVTDASLTLPQYTKFISEAIDGINYNFVTVDSYTVNTTANTANFIGVELKQGIPTKQTFTVNSTANPTYTFDIPDLGVDTTSLLVTVQQSSSNASYTVYNLSSDYLILDGTSTVYFLQEGINGHYQIYFGDGILGQQLSDGNVVNVSYIVTQGTAAAGAKYFVLMNSISGYGNTVVYPVVPATNGGNQETLASIQFQAPKTYSAQGRAVTKDDYITLIQRNQLGFAFDAVNVWGGEENNPPVYGQVFICLKPAGAYLLTDTQKKQIMQNIIDPVSVVTVQPTIVDPDYTYLQLSTNVYYDPTKTNQTSAQLQAGIISAIQTFGTTTLNTFNSSFNAYDLLGTIQNYDPSVITSEYTLKLQKKFFPSITNPETYNLYYHTPLQRGVYGSSITSSPGLQFINPANTAATIDNVFIEEVPQQTFGVDNIIILNPGFSYQSAPTITIQGDGTGATATATIVNGSINSITITNAGNNYTSAIATVTPAYGDTTGTNAVLVVNLQGQYGTLRSYYYNTTNVKTILNSNVGSVDYVNGIITLNSFKPTEVDNPLGQFAITATPTSSILKSTYNGILTIDPFDATAISVTMTAKTN